MSYTYTFIAYRTVVEMVRNKGFPKEHSVICLTAKNNNKSVIKFECQKSL